MKFIILMVMMVSAMFSQPRVNGSIIDFDKKGEVFSNANFYYYEKDQEKWIEKTRAVKDYFGVAQFMTMKFYGEIYYVLVSETVDVRYKYPKLELERYLAPIYKGFVFEKNEFDNLGKYIDARSISDELRTDKFDLDELRIMVVQTLKKERKQYGDFVFKVKIEDENTIRFRFPENQSGYLTAFDKLYFETSIKDFENFLKI